MVSLKQGDHPHVSETKAMLHARTAPWQLMDGTIMLVRLVRGTLAAS